nr:hypothetical protein [Tanacetum cinerariifolium]
PPQIYHHHFCISPLPATHHHLRTNIITTDATTTTHEGAFGLGLAATRGSVFVVYDICAKGALVGCETALGVPLAVSNTTRSGSGEWRDDDDGVGVGLVAVAGGGAKKMEEESIVCVLGDKNE